jgi:hypothetical protein
LLAIWNNGCVAVIFFSYSHKDEDLRDQLETHLSSLQRQGIISSWHDRRITAGTEFDGAIDEHLDSADVILLLISPDFIASDYCYEREVARAMERQRVGEARVIPVILRPCDWQNLSFGKLLTAPKDGRAITKWPNQDEAFLDVVTAIKRALNEGEQVRTPRTPLRNRQEIGPDPDPEPHNPTEVIRSSNLRIRKYFTDLDKDRFLHEGFAYISKFFENSMKELVGRNPTLEYRFRQAGVNTFNATIYRGGKKVCAGSASVGGGAMGNEGIEYSMTDSPQHGTMNEAVYAKADEQSLYFEPLGMQSHGRGREKLTFQGAAEFFWGIFVQPLQH